MRDITKINNPHVPTLEEQGHRTYQGAKQEYTLRVKMRQLKETQKQFGSSLEMYSHMTKLNNKQTPTCLSQM